MYDTIWGTASANDAAIYMEELYNFYINNNEYGNKLMEYFSAIVDRIGMEEFKKILHKMEELEEIMVDESMKM